MRGHVSFQRLQSLVALSLMVIALSLLTPSFLTIENVLNILRQISINLCLSIGMTLVILSGGIDLSVGAVLGLSGAIAAGLYKSGMPVPGTDYVLELTLSGAIWAALIVGALAGACNGVAISFLRLPPFVATLAMLSIASGFTLLFTHGFPITGLGATFGFIGTGTWLGIPMPVWEVGLLAAGAAVLCRWSVFGRHLYAIGGSERAARLTGLNVERTKITIYTLCGALSGFAGLIVSARLDSAQPNAGSGYELDSIAAVVIGGTSLSGGQGSIQGTLLGCLIIGILSNGLFLLNVSPFWQQVVKGAVILLAVAADRLGTQDARLA